MQLRRWPLAALTVGAVGLAPAAASALPTTTSFTCRGSTAIVNAGGETRLEPLVANADRNASCRTDGVGVPLNLQNALGLNTISASAPTAFAQTALANAGGPTFQQSAASQAGVENLDLNLGGGQLRVQAQAVIAAAGANCTNGAPAFPTFSRVVGLTINGMPVVGGAEASIPLDSGLGSAFDQLAATPLSGIVRVATEKVQVTGTPGGTDEGRVVEAIRIDLLSAAGTPAATVIIGRAEAGRVGAVCTPPGTPGTNTNTGGGGGGTSTDSSNNGSGTGRSSTSDGNNTNGNRSGSGVDSGKPVPNGINGGRCARLSAFYDLPGGGIAKSGPRSIRSKYGIRQVIRGRVLNCNGKSIVKARIEQVHYFRGNMKRIKTGLRTRPGGKFTLILPLNVRTRSIILSYRGIINNPKVASQKKMGIRVFRRGVLLR